MNKPRVGYWNIRGYGQPIRLLLAYTGTDFEDKRYNWRDADASEWYSDKPTLGLDFPNIPYYIDDDVKLSQTFAILKYLGRKHKLDPQSEEERKRVDLIEAEAEDMRVNWVNLCYYATDFEKSKPEYLENVSAKMKEVSKFLGNNEYFAGNHITYIDFLMYEILDVNSTLEPNLLSELSNLKDFHARMQSLPTLAAFMKSDKFMARPLTGPMAHWGSD